MGIIKGLGKLRDPANFRAWAYGVTTNKSIDWIRKIKAAKHISIVKIIAWQMAHRHGIKREIKRLELRIAELNKTVKNR